MWVGLISSMEDLKRTKWLSKIKLLLPDCFELDHQSLPASRLLLNCQLFSGLQLAGFELELRLGPSWVSSLPADCGSWIFSTFIIA